MSASAAFKQAIENGNGSFPQAEGFPVAYGYNTLLLSNDSAVILDMPTTAYLSTLQTQISADETVNITATVNAYQATYNDSTTAVQTDDALWADIMRSSLSAGMTTLDLYGEDFAHIGIMPFDSNTQVLFALYYNSTTTGKVIAFAKSSHDQEFERFRKRAQIYSLRRASCRAHWSMNTSSIVLLAGDCDAASVANSSILQVENMDPYAYDALTGAGWIYKDLINATTDSVWLRATYAVSIVTMYWARGLSLGSERHLDMAYKPIDEELVSSRQTLRAEGLLFFVLLVQPILTIVAFAVAVCLYKTPISRNFGITSILSGFKSVDTGLIYGAGLSGSLREPVRLTVAVESISPSSSVKSGSSTARIRYDLEREPTGESKRYSLRKGGLYNW